MFFFAEATTQPANSEWVWTNISAEKLALYITVWGSLLATLIIAIFKLINLFIEQLWGSRRLWRQQMEARIAANTEATIALAKGSPISSAPVTPEVEAKINHLASQPPPLIPPSPPETP